ncbi:MAG: STAS domain-containing protein [Chloroflexi bacterium]|nr:STAS domain-containing protein [Chloroflexota bacterium]
MNLDITDKPWGERGATITVKGEVDIYTAAQVRQTILGAVDGGRVQLVANLHEVTYLDSTGLGVFIGALKRARERSGDMVIVCAHPRLVKIFEITGLTKIFRVFPDESSAIEALSSAAGPSREESA